jgi:hypothetical protein
MEPRAATPQRRRDAIRALNYAGIPVGVMFAPVIPALNDEELETVLASATEAGASSAGYVLLRLPLEIKDLFREWLEDKAAGRAKHVMSLIRQMRGGKDYDSQWHTRMKGTGPYAEMIARRFHMAVKRLGLNQLRSPLALHKFRRPPRPGDQLPLLCDAERFCLHPGQHAQRYGLHRHHKQHSQTRAGTPRRTRIRLRDEIQRHTARLVRRASALRRRDSARDEHQAMEARVEAVSHRENKSRLGRSARTLERLTSPWPGLTRRW